MQRQGFRLGDMSISGLEFRPLGRGRSGEAWWICCMA